MFREQTPIERFVVRDRLIYVKREDLYGIYPAPPLAKLRGMRVLLNRLYEEGVRLVGCWDTRISKLGQGLAASCNELPELRCIVSYPTKKGEKQPDSIQIAADLGAEIYPVPGSRITICYAQARRYVTEKGGVMLPFGLECEETVDGVRREANRVPPELVEGGTIVLCCGSGVTLAGLLSGLPVLPHKIMGLSSGRSVTNIRACLGRYIKELPTCLELHEATTPYSTALSFPCPFPSHPNYDLKAWKFLCDNVHDYRDPVLFWNIGA